MKSSMVYVMASLVSNRPGNTYLFTLGKCLKFKETFDRFYFFWSFCLHLHLLLLMIQRTANQRSITLGCFISKGSIALVENYVKGTLFLQYLKFKKKGPLCKYEKKDLN